MCYVPQVHVIIIHVVIFLEHDLLQWFWRLDRKVPKLNQVVLVPKPDQGVLAPNKSLLDNVNNSPKVIICYNMWCVYQ